MPINIPSGLYTGGRATFDTSPMTTAILKQNALQRAQKAAEAKAAKAAIEKNLDRMLTATNMAGVRQQEIDDVKDPVTGQIIAKGLQTLGREIYQEGVETGKLPWEKIMQFRANVERSKGLLEEGKRMHQAALDEKAMPMLGDVNLLEEHDYSMFDPRHKSHNVSEMPLFVPDLDEDKWLKGIFGSTKPLTPIGKAETAPGGAQKVSILGYNDKEIKDFADISASLVRTSPSALKTYGEKANNKAFIDVALPLVKKFYGANAEIKTPEDAARASVLLEAQGRKERVTSPIKPPREMKEWEWKALTGGDAAKNELYLNQFVGGAYQKGTQASATIKGKKYEGKYISVPIGVVDKFTIDRGKDWEQKPIQFLMTPDKQQVIPLYQKRDKDGNDMFTASGNPLLDTSNPYSKPMDIQSFKAELAPVVLSKKTTGEEITEEVGVPVPSATPQTKSTKAVKATKRKYD